MDSPGPSTAIFVATVDPHDQVWYTMEATDGHTLPTSGPLAINRQVVIRSPQLQLESTDNSQWKDNMIAQR